MALSDVRIIEFPRITDPRGNLTFVQHPHQLPFEIKRAYWVYDVPAGSERGGHSHHCQSECIIAAAGSFTVEVTDGVERRRFLLNRPFQGLLVVPGIWRTLDDFSSGAVCLVFNSGLFSEEDYERDYTRYLQSVNAQNSRGQQ